MKPCATPKIIFILLWPSRIINQGTVFTSIYPLWCCRNNKTTWRLFRSDYTKAEYSSSKIKCRKWPQPSNSTSNCPWFLSDPMTSLRLRRNACHLDWSEADICSINSNSLRKRTTGSYSEFQEKCSWFFTTALLLAGCWSQARGGATSHLLVNPSIIWFRNANSKSGSQPVGTFSRPAIDVGNEAVLDSKLLQSSKLQSSKSARITWNKVSW